VAIVYDTQRGQFVFSARHWYNRTSSYICQLQQQQGLRVNDDDVAGALKMQDRKMTDKDIAGGGKCRTGI